jgi:hypothetical protein
VLFSLHEAIEIGPVRENSPELLLGGEMVLSTSKRTDTLEVKVTIEPQIEAAVYTVSGKSDTSREIVVSEALELYNVLFEARKLADRSGNKLKVYYKIGERMYEVSGLRHLLGS